jgi:hypothetical protein
MKPSNPTALTNLLSVKNKPYQGHSTGFYLHNHDNKELTEVQY